MLALGAGLDALQPSGDGEFDSLVVAGFEVQEAMLLAAAPIAAIERRVAKDVQRGTDIPAVAFGIG